MNIEDLKAFADTIATQTKALLGRENAKLRAELMATAESIKADTIAQLENSMAQMALKLEALKGTNTPDPDAIAEMVKGLAVKGDPGEPGKDAELDLALIESTIERLLLAHIEKIPKPENGKDGAPGKDGKDGADGRDALNLEILPAIDFDKSYPRNTFATHEGSLWRSYSQTSEKRGWEIIVTGQPQVEIEQQNLKHFTFIQRLPNGNTQQKTFTLPVMIYRGIWKEGDFTAGDTVTSQGSLWVCLKDTQSKPMDGNTDWQLAAKRGRDART